jgi:lipoprotein-anchoring transpeptidase ErfK/SrfK
MVTLNKKIVCAAAATLTLALLIGGCEAQKGSGSLQAGAQATTGLSLSSLHAQAKEAEARGNLLTARSLYQQLMTDFANSSEVSSWQKKLDELNIKLLFSQVITPRSTSYEIKPGDTLTKIARDFKTTIDLLKKSNAITDDRIIPGKKIKVWTASFNILIDKSQNILLLKTDEDIIKTYMVATGINNSTPVGTFTITKKIINPTWFKPGAVIPAGSPENLLGTRWLGFDLAGYGIHGTNDPQTLGRQVTQGCVRMANRDVEELYTIIPEGTEVTIID